jgi:hypothetical protein
VGGRNGERSTAANLGIDNATRPPMRECTGEMSVGIADRWLVNLPVSPFNSPALLATE